MGKVDGSRIRGGMGLIGFGGGRLMSVILGFSRCLFSLWCFFHAE